MTDIIKRLIEDADGIEMTADERHFPAHFLERAARYAENAREAAQLLERGSWKPSEEAVARIISYHARIAVTYDSVQRRYEHVSNADELARAILALSPDPAFLGEIEEASSPTRAASPASGLTATAPHSQSEKES